MARVPPLEVPARATDRLHLPWQGSWQADAAVFAEPVSFTGISVPVFLVESRARHCAVFVDLREDCAATQITLRFHDDRLSLVLDGNLPETPSVRFHEVGDRSSVLDWIRARCATLQTGAARRFQYVFILDVTDPRGQLIQGFADVQRFIDQCAASGVSQGALFYLPGWDGAYDGTYPDYRASEPAGGEAGLARLVSHARACGGEVMPHLNFWGLSHARAAAYPHLERWVLRDEQGNRQGWPGAIWCGATNPLYYVNPISDAWLGLFDDRLSSLEQLGIRAVYLDQLAPPLGPNSRFHTREFARIMHERHPRLTFAGEMLNLDVLAQVPLFQMLGPVWTGMQPPSVLQPSRLLVELVGRAGQVCGHLATPAMYPTRYAWTNYVFIAEHGPEGASARVREFYEAAGLISTFKINATRAAANQSLLATLPRPSTGG